MHSLSENRDTVAAGYTRAPRAALALALALALVAALAALGCRSSSPSGAASVTLDHAALDSAWVSGTQDDAGVLTVTVALGVSSSASVCPVLTQAVAQVNSIPMQVVGAGGLGSQCEYNSEGICSDSYYSVCSSPTYTLAGAPAGPLAIVVEDSSRSLEVDVDDMGAARSIAVVSLTNATAGEAGAMTLAWSPASDTTTKSPTGSGTPPTAFDVASISFVPDDGVDALQWAEGIGITVQGADITSDSRYAFPTGGSSSSSSAGDGAPSAPAPESGTFSVTADCPIATTRCDLGLCSAELTASPSVAAVWAPL
jgi:hypothetical protein